MSQVFLAERVSDFGQRVVVKLGDANEGNLLSQLRHEHIVQLIGGGESDYGDYLALEYVDGVAIDAFCRDNNCSLDQRLELLQQVLSAVGYAHRHLIIHADLKPSNVLVADGQVKILDFGIAQRAETAANPFYTPLYASPEQREGKPLSAATDVFLLGKLTGELLKDSLRGDLAAIVQKATAQRVEDRYAFVEAMLEDIGRVRRGEATSVRPLGRVEQAARWIRRRPLAATGLAAIALIIVAGSREIVDHHARAVAERQLADRQLRELVRLNGLLGGELYEATDSLHGAEGARAKLRSSALETLDAVTPDAGDRKLRVELARQYERIAELQMKDQLKVDAANTARRGLQILGKDDRALQARLHALATPELAR